MAENGVAYGIPFNAEKVLKIHKDSLGTLEIDNQPNDFKTMI